MTLNFNDTERNNNKITTFSMNDTYHNNTAIMLSFAFNLLLC